MVVLIADNDLRPTRWRRMRLTAGARAVTIASAVGASGAQLDEQLPELADGDLVTPPIGVGNCFTGRIG